MLTHLLFHGLCILGLGLYALVLFVPLLRPVRTWYARQAAQATVENAPPTSDA